MIVAVITALGTIVFWRLRDLFIPVPIESLPKHLWEGLTALCLLVTLVATMLYIARIKVFFVVVSDICPSGTLKCALRWTISPRLWQVRASAVVAGRRDEFRTLVNELKSFNTSANLDDELGNTEEKPEYYAQVVPIKKNLLVVGFDEWAKDADLDHSRLEGLLPPGMLAPSAEDVEVVAVLEAIHPSYYGAEQPLEMGCFAFKLAGACASRGYRA